MISILDPQQYVDYLAEFLGIVHKFPLPINQLSSVRDYEDIMSKTMESLGHAWNCGVSSFLAMLESSLKSERDSPSYVRAAAVAIWMDEHISYLEHPGSQYVSLHRMVPLSGNRPVFIDRLNSNEVESGIQLHPKFEVCRVFNQTANKTEPFASRDVFDGLNGQLNNVTYVSYDANRTIHNVVIPYVFKEGECSETFRIAFCPMSDNPSLLITEDQLVSFEGIPMNVRSLLRIRNEEQLVDRFNRDIRLACKNHADIVFFPEMLGMKQLEQESAGYNTLLSDILLDVMSEAQRIGADIKPPMITFLPSWWRDGVNSTTAVYQSGAILGSQKKYIPYVSKGNWRERLQEEKNKHYLVIHIPELYRIVVVICAEFLPLRDHMASVLCGGLGATLVLVPSYSKGEQEFINSLPTLKDYGATVIWGNCCGAVRPPRVIGASSIAGFDSINRFGENCKCNESCDGNDACLFLVTLPLDLKRKKPFEPTLECGVIHYLLPNTST